MKLHLEYIWLDGNMPQQIRSKTKIIDSHVGNDIKLKDIPEWNFDGSSTNQADTSKSDLILKPVSVFPDPFKQFQGLLVLCEVFDLDGKPHKSNTRNAMVETVKQKDQETWYGWEQEYFIYSQETDRPLGWSGLFNRPKKPQGEFYCSNGSNNAFGRTIAEAHIGLCEKAGINISGINAEVAPGQWEYQIGPVKAIEGADQLWIARYLMNRLAEHYNMYIVLHPKPYIGNEWNGSGMHVNFSTKEMRKKKSMDIIETACKKLSNRVKEHIDVYGIDNHLRLTGENETSSINEFKYGIADRTASIRIASSFSYLEDRRPASNADPYQIVKVLLETIC